MTNQISFKQFCWWEYHFRYLQKFNWSSAHIKKEVEEVIDWISKIHMTADQDKVEDVVLHETQNSGFYKVEPFVLNKTENLGSYKLNM